MGADQALPGTAEAPVRSGGVRAAWRQRLVVWSCHWVLYLVLVAVSLGVVLGGGAAYLTVGLAVAFGGWYGYWNLRAGERLARSRRTLLAYLAVGAVLWLALLAVDRDYGVVGVVVVAQLFGLLDWRPALGVVAAVTGVSVLAGGVQGSLGSGPLTWQGLRSGSAVASAVLFGLVVLCVYLDREVARARAELAAEQRRAGALAERGRLAADLHDTLTQDLASIVMLLEGARKSCVDESSDQNAGGTAVMLDQALSTARSGLADVRGLVWDLRPEALDRETLDQAVTAAADRLAAHTGVEVRTVVTGQPRRLPAVTETVLLRVTEEALANVRRHAGAGAVTVTLSYIGDLVAVDVTDDGAGFDPATPVVPSRHSGLGLATMGERVASVGGSLAVESAPGEGTSVAAQVPVT